MTAKDYYIYILMVLCSFLFVFSLYSHYLQTAKDTFIKTQCFDKGALSANWDQKGRFTNCQYPDTITPLTK